ncbi:hypothetical protein JL722_9940 [Aureococcus anophagefferens]|nr:hypothetical protein JL722_9940 [Aureococcus anophagefferens]
MVQFFLCQLRWQYGTIVAPGGGFAAFDEALAAADASQGPEDVASCGDLMNAFLRGPALGDRWVPWHTRGDGGANYCDYIIHRHAHFAEIGLAAYDLVAAPGGVSLAALDACYRGFDRIGPTMSKVLLVTNHLWRPHLNILGDDCEVGDGAEAFSFLCGRRRRRAKRRLRHLFDHLNSPALDAAEPRFRPMIAWVAGAAVPGHPGGAIAGAATICDARSSSRVAQVPQERRQAPLRRARRRALSVYDKMARGRKRKCNLHGIISD